MLPIELRVQSLEAEERLRAIDRNDVTRSIITSYEGTAYLLAIVPNGIRPYDFGATIRISKEKPIVKFFTAIGFPPKRKNDLGWNYYDRHNCVLFYVQTKFVEKGKALRFKCYPENYFHKT